MKNNISKFAVLACVACFALSSQSEAAPHGAPGFVKQVPHGAQAHKQGDRYDAKQMHNAAMEKARMEKELKKNSAELDKLNTKLGNPGFVAKAPEHIITAERERATKLAELVAKLEEQLKGM